MSHRSSYRRQSSRTLNLQDWIDRTVSQRSDPTKEPKSGRLHQHSSEQPHFRPIPATSAAVVASAAIPYSPMVMKASLRMSWTLGPWCVWEVAAATVGLSAPDEHETAIHQASAVGASDLHSAYIARSERGRRVNRTTAAQRGTDRALRPEPSTCPRTCAP